MSGPIGETRSLVQWLDDSAGLGRLRVDALLTMLRPFGCTIHVHRASAGLRSVHICGPRAVVEHLRDRLDGLLAELDQAAKDATRRYGTWLRDQEEPDHQPAQRRDLTRRYRRVYLAAWADAWSQRISGLIRDDAPPARPAPVIGHGRAVAAAAFDVAQLDLAALREAAAVIAAHDPSRHPAVVAAAATPPAESVHPDGPGRIAPGQRVTCLPGSLPARDGGRGRWGTRVDRAEDLRRRRVWLGPSPHPEPPATPASRTRGRRGTGLARPAHHGRVGSRLAAWLVVAGLDHRRARRVTKCSD